MRIPKDRETEKQIESASNRNLNGKQAWPNGGAVKKESEEKGFELDENRAVHQTPQSGQPPHTGRTDSTTNTQ